MSDEAVLRSVDAFGFEFLEQQLSAGTGVLLVTAHFGNWERLAQYITAKGLKLNVIARDANDAKLNELVNRKRREQGVDVFSRGSAARDVLASLKRNEIVGILPDQNTWELYIPFFGFPAGTVAGPAVFHLRTGAPIVFAFCREQPDGKYLLECDLYSPPERSGDRDADVAKIMSDVNERIEQAVRAHPEQWLWMHDRWKAARQQGMLGG
jgi:KDO2-lipid IV(A) lauroyltransferase